MRPTSCCWTKATRSSAPPKARAAALAAAVLTALLAACAPGAPPGVDKAELDAAIGRAIGDPNTCVLIATRDAGKVLYRYNSATACARQFPACDKPGVAKLSDKLDAVAGDGQPRLASCDSAPGRGVGWAAGPVAGKDLVYAAVMEGDRVLPGMVIADRLEGAFRRAKVSAP